MELVLEGAKLLFKPDRKNEVGTFVRPDIERHDQVIPHPQELKDAEACQRRHRQRHDQAGEDLDMVGTIDPRTFQQLARQADNIVPKKIDRQWQTKGSMGDPQTCEGL